MSQPLRLDENAIPLLIDLIGKLGNALDWYFGFGKDDFWILRPSVRFLDDPVTELIYWLSYCAFMVYMITQDYTKDIEIKKKYRQYAHGTIALMVVFLLTPIFKVACHYSIVAYWTVDWRGVFTGRYVMA